MLHSLGDPHGELDFIHIGGTNGKGSTAAHADSILRASGRFTGLYTSPHLRVFAERIRIGGALADLELLEDCAKDVFPLAEREDATFFESTTVLAFEAFRRAGCRTVVAEVGLGGRLDATNVVTPRVTVITSVDLDHSEYLGDTLEEIAAEKAGILKHGVPLVSGPLFEGPKQVVAARAGHLGAPVDTLGDDFSVEDVVVDRTGTTFTYRSTGGISGLRSQTPLVGGHQARNAALAIRALEWFDSGVTDEHVAQGLAAVRWPGRFEVLSADGGTWVLDIAHNVAAATNLAELLATAALPEPLVLLVAILGDKPWPEMLGPLLSSVRTSVFTVAPSSPPERRWRPEEALEATGGRNVEIEPEFARAVERARELAGAGTVVVTGSAHTVGDARTLILGSTEEE
jgi:dihydrofolate synthase/folylpolyglutamate synthase